jgi:hypothetical protein
VSDVASQADKPVPRGRLDLLGWLGLLTGIAGLGSGYFYYLWTITYPEVTWGFTDQIVFNSQNVNPDLQLFDRGARIEHNVYAANISVSNTGSALLEHTNVVGSLVRSPLMITLPGAKDAQEQIIASSIVNVSPKSPVNLDCEYSPSNVSVTWDHLDPGSGFRLLLIYTASRQLPPTAEISVVGMQKATFVDLKPERLKSLFIPTSTRCL